MRGEQCFNPFFHNLLLLKKKTGNYFSGFLKSSKILNFASYVKFSL